MPYIAAAMDSIISIHALLAESDIWKTGKHIDGAQFLSTLSLRRATVHSGYLGVEQDISIHALLAESDIICEF